MNKKILTILYVMSLIVALVAVPFVSSCAQPSQPSTPAPAPAPAPAPQPKALKAVSFLAKDNPNMTYANVFTDRVNEQGKGILTIDYVGGPEVVAGFDQMAALRSGAMDIIFNPTAYYAAFSPAADTLSLSQSTPMEERKNGLYDFMVEIHKRAGAYYVGRYSANLPFHIFTTKKQVSKVEDFKGMKLRSGALYDEFMKGIGAIPTTIPWPDVYNAASQGVIDGAGGSGFEWAPKAYAEMFHYAVYPPFYEQNLTILVNLDVWNKLAKKQQDLMLDVCIKMEPEMAKYFGDKKKELFGMMEANGMKAITLPADEAKKYLDIAYSAAWDVAKKKVSPEDYNKLRQLMIK